MTEFYMYFKLAKLVHFFFSKMMFLTQAIYSSSFSTKLLIVQFHCKMCDFFGIFPVFKSLVQLHEIIFLVLSLIYLMQDTI